MTLTQCHTLHLFQEGKSERWDNGDKIGGFCIFKRDSEQNLMKQQLAKKS